MYFWWRHLETKGIEEENKRRAGNAFVFIDECIRKKGGGTTSIMSLLCSISLGKTSRSFLVNDADDAAVNNSPDNGDPGTYVFWYFMFSCIVQKAKNRRDLSPPFFMCHPPKHGLIGNQLNWCKFISISHQLPLVSTRASKRNQAYKKGVSQWWWRWWSMHARSVCVQRIQRNWWKIPFTQDPYHAMSFVHNLEWAQPLNALESVSHEYCRSKMYNSNSDLLHQFPFSFPFPQRWLWDSIKSILSP